jgi:hypothetical protein
MPTTGMADGADTLTLDSIVPDHESRDHDVILVRRTIHLGKPRGVGKLEWRGNGEGMGRGRSVHEHPGAKVDRIAPRKGGIPRK